MRNLIISRILHLFLCNGGGTPGQTMNLNSMRFECCYRNFMEMTRPSGYTPPRRHKGPLVLTEDDLGCLTDGQLVDFYEQVVRRANVCM